MVLEKASSVFAQHWVQEKLWSIAMDYHDQQKVVSGSAVDIFCSVSLN